MKKKSTCGLFIDADNPKNYYNNLKIEVPGSGNHIEHGHRNEYHGPGIGLSHVKKLLNFIMEKFGLNQNLAWEVRSILLFMTIIRQK